MATTVSATLIVRDEAHFLPDCLAALAGLVDEVVIADTGSRDGTRAIALASGAKTFDFPWIDDFAAARNAALEAASGDWILYIDADERLSAPAGLRLGDALNDPGAVGATLQFHPRLGATPYLETRLFRNDPRIRFVGAIHETMLPAIDGLVADAGKRILATPFAIQHLGYEGDLTHKHRRNLPMLLTMVERWPDRLYYWHDLAQALNALGRPDEAIEACRRGLAKAGEFAHPGRDPIAGLIAYTYADVLRQRGEDALPIIAEGLRFDPQHLGLRFLEARALADARRFDEALTIIDTLLAIDSATFADPLISYDARIFGVDALELKAVALLRSGRRVEAGRAFAAASALAPHELSYKVKATALLGEAPGAKP